MTHSRIVFSILLIFSFNHSQATIPLCELENLAPLVTVTTAVPGILGIYYFSQHCAHRQFLVQNTEAEPFIASDNETNAPYCIKKIAQIGLCGIGWLGVLATAFLAATCTKVY